MCKLLNDRLDYLLVGQHWFVDHARRTRDKRVVASTADARPAGARTRSRDGIHLMATREAQARIGSITIHDNAITFCIDGSFTVSGVYFPPRRESGMLWRRWRGLMRSWVTSTQSFLGCGSIQEAVRGDLVRRTGWLRSETSSNPTIFYACNLAPAVDCWTRWITASCTETTGDSPPSIMD